MFIVQLNIDINDQRQNWNFTSTTQFFCKEGPKNITKGEATTIARTGGLVLAVVVVEWKRCLQWEWSSMELRYIHASHVQQFRPRLFPRNDMDYIYELYVLIKFNTVMLILLTITHIIIVFTDSYTLVKFHYNSLEI